MNKTSSRAYLILRWAILILVLAAIYLPLLMIVIYSFSASQSVGGEYGEFTFRLYEKLIENSDILVALRNTLVIGLSSAALATILGTTASIGIHYMKKKFRLNRHLPLMKCFCFHNRLQQFRLR